MSYYLTSLPLEIQTSIAELRLLNTPESAIELLIERIFKASEAKTTSLQMDVIRIEDSMSARQERIAQQLTEQLQAQLGATNVMLIALRAAQQIAHPQITDALNGIGALRKVTEDIELWGSRIEQAFIYARDVAADERARIEGRIDAAIEIITERVDQLDARVAVIEQVIVPAAAADG